MLHQKEAAFWKKLTTIDEKALPLYGKFEEYPQTIKAPAERVIENIVEPPVSDRYKPLNQKFTIKTQYSPDPEILEEMLQFNKDLGSVGMGAYGEDLYLKYTYGNNQNTFANNTLVNILGTLNMNPGLYNELKKFYYFPETRGVPEALEGMVR